ncbi:unnamed protein product [Arabis nemorensis]|uniref:F-box domain-containing protein n=1 Tax=Arabis nemorensis TaxID=586526 RepID=A0A565BX00_9BRAS|nr:unnamed protein product [Arabis nemorensis]
MGSSRRSLKLGSSKKKKTTRRAKENLLDLPYDLLLLVISFLPLKDNIRASTVCKKLQEACVSVRVADKSPWLIYFTKTDDGSYELYDPSMQKSYNLESPEITGFRVCYSKDGWLLMYNPNTQQLLFFNPFSRDRIPVPSLWMGYDQRMAFSCAPTSASCLLFTVVTDVTLKKITVKTCSPNAKEWTTTIFRERLPQNFDSFERILFANGVFFCLAESGCLSIFCPSSKTWSVLPGRAPKDIGNTGCFMTEHQGKIFLIYTYNHMSPTVLKLEDTRLEWTEMKTLGGLTIYASPLSSESRAEQNQPSGIKNCLCLSVFHGFNKTCIYYNVGEESLIFFKWKKHDPYGNIWVMPPLNLLDLPFV